MYSFLQNSAKVISCLLVPKVAVEKSQAGLIVLGFMCNFLVLFYFLLFFPLKILFLLLFFGIFYSTLMS